MTLAAACSTGTSDVAPPASTTTGSQTPSTTLVVSSATALDSSSACSYLASTIPGELTRWAGSDDVANAPIAETRLGLQPDGGVPGTLSDGCVWEVRSSDGGHVGVVVERFVDVDMTLLATMAADVAVSPTELADGRNRWDVPASDDPPSGAVLIGDAGRLVVIRVESHSDNPDRTFIAGTLEGSDHFFAAVGDAVAASQPD